MERGASVSSQGCLWPGHSQLCLSGGFHDVKPACDVVRHGFLQLHQMKGGLGYGGLGDLRTVLAENHEDLH